MNPTTPIRVLLVNTMAVNRETGLTTVQVVGAGPIRHVCFYSTVDVKPFLGAIVEITPQKTPGQRFLNEHMRTGDDVGVVTIRIGQWNRFIREIADLIDSKT